MSKNGDCVSRIKGMLASSVPLVSVIVITYNSGRHVLETLDSALSQTYNNLELIIADDGSQDNTLDLCSSWLSIHGSRFIYSELIKSEKNTGIPANCNRGIRASHGEWVKLIAGDDILLPNAVKSLVDSVDDSINFLFGKMQLFTECNEEKILLDSFLPTEGEKVVFSFDAGCQNKLLQFINFVPAPTSLIRRSCLEELGFFDAKFKLIEDYPLWLKATKFGKKLDYIDKLVVYYRQSEASLTGGKQSYYNKHFFECQVSMIRALIVESDPLIGMIFRQSLLFDKLRFRILTLKFKNRRSKRSIIWAKMARLSLVFWINLLLRHFLCLVAFVKGKNKGGSCRCLLRESAKE